MAHDTTLVQRVPPFKNCAAAGSDWLRRPPARMAARDWAGGVHSRATVRQTGRSRTTDAAGHILALNGAEQSAGAVSAPCKPHAYCSWLPGRAVMRVDGLGPAGMLSTGNPRPGGPVLLHRVGSRQPGAPLLHRGQPRPHGLCAKDARGPRPSSDRHGACCPPRDTEAMVPIARGLRGRLSGQPKPGAMACRRGRRTTTPCPCLPATRRPASTAMPIPARQAPATPSPGKPRMATSHGLQQTVACRPVQAELPRRCMPSERRARLAHDSARRADAKRVDRGYPTGRQILAFS